MHETTRTLKSEYCPQLEVTVTDGLTKHSHTHAIVTFGLF